MTRNLCPKVAKNVKNCQPLKAFEKCQFQSVLHLLKQTKKKYYMRLISSATSIENLKIQSPVNKIGIVVTLAAATTMTDYATIRTILEGCRLAVTKTTRGSVQSIVYPVNLAHMADIAGQLDSNTIVDLVGKKVYISFEVSRAGALRLTDGDYLSVSLTKHANALNLEVFAIDAAEESDLYQEIMPIVFEAGQVKEISLQGVHTITIPVSMFGNDSETILEIRYPFKTVNYTGDDLRIIGQDISENGIRFVATNAAGINLPFDQAVVIAVENGTTAKIRLQSAGIVYAISDKF